MLKKSLAVLVLLILAGVVMAARTQDTVRLNGYVIDNMCAGAHASDGKLNDVAENHPKKCALMPSCAKSGYAVVSEGKLYKLDDAGNSKVADLLKNTKRDKGLPVTVEGTIEGDTLHVQTITETGA